MYLNIALVNVDRKLWLSAAKIITVFQVSKK